MIVKDRTGTLLSPNERSPGDILARVSSAQYLRDWKLNGCNVELDPILDLD